MKNSILIIDDDQDFLETARRVLRLGGFRNILLTDAPSDIEDHFHGDAEISIAIIDVNLPGTDGIAVLEKIRSMSPGTECIMLTGIHDTATIVRAMKKGAYDYLPKPLENEELLLAVNQALERRRLLKSLEISQRDGKEENGLHPAFKKILTHDRKMRKVLTQAQLHAASEVPSLITGESGTGKELLARAIHLASPRAGSPFTAVNMASLSDTLFDAEFFGHTRGAFTGAHAEREGYLEATRGGTLFLDEIGHLSLELQGKLLRVLQEGEYRKLGTNAVKNIDLRFIAATNVDLEKAMDQGEFRPDLYYRLKGAWLHLPPLRERKDDIGILAAGFFKTYSPVAFREGGFSPEAMEVLAAHDYPGNIRELEMIVQSAVNLSRGRSITPDHLPGDLVRPRPRPQLPQMEEGAPTPLAEVERQHIIKTYAALGNNKVQTANALGIGLNTLRRKLVSYGEP